MSGLFWLLRQGSDFTFEYRRGPVPHTSGRRSRRNAFFRGLRRFHNFVERRENSFVGIDDDCARHGIRVRPSRRPGNFRHFWDEVDRRGDGRSWKGYRGTRYRTDAR